MLLKEMHSLWSANISPRSISVMARLGALQLFSQRSLRFQLRTGMLNVQLPTFTAGYRAIDTCFGAFKVLCCMRFRVFMPVSRGFIENAREQYSYVVFGLYRRLFRVILVLYTKQFLKRGSGSVVYVALDGCSYSNFEHCNGGSLNCWTYL